MAVGFKVKYYWYPIGSGDFLNAFFSTIWYHAENRKWGSNFPTVMNELYMGSVEPENLVVLNEELNSIVNILKEIKPDKVIWDFDDLSKMPPWGDSIADTITNLSNYFVTSEGEDLIIILRKAIDDAIRMNLPLLIVSL